MNSIAIFFTIYWCIYFPTCIAYNDLPGLSSIDEVMTGILVLYTFAVKGKYRNSDKVWKEFIHFICILVFFTLYGLLFGRNISGGVWLDFIQELRPYSVIYCTWILNPQFSKSQKHFMLGIMVLTLFSWILIHPIDENSEFPVLGQLAICTGMSWFLLTKATKRNAFFALLLVFSGLLAPKFKFMGEVVCFIAMVFFLKKRLNFKSSRTLFYSLFLLSVVLIVTWTRFDVYYVSGMDNEELARPMTYKTAVQILFDYFPFGSGMGSFACNGAWKYYSPLYYEYGLNKIWGLDPGGGFIADAYYPTLAQFGFVGLFFFIVFWKRRLLQMNRIIDMRYYKVAWITFFCLAIEQTADSSWLSGKGMGYCMLLALCLNANRNMIANEELVEDESGLTDSDSKHRRRGLLGLGHNFKANRWRKDKK